MAFEIPVVRWRRSARRPPRLRRALPATLGSSLVSVAGLVGRRVTDLEGHEVGRLADVVVRWDDVPYPAVAGFVVRVGRRRVWVAADHVEDLDRSALRLRSARVDLRDVQVRPGEVALVQYVLDRQLVDVDGLRVVRAADLYLARAADSLRLVGVDVGFQSLMRRLGPRRRRARPTPTRVIDWSTVQPFAAPGAAVHLTRASDALRRLRPAELADLLEELGREQRQELLGALEPELAADAMEELDDEDVEAILTSVPVAQAAQLVGDMAPDEAADALRGLDDEDRDRILAALPPDEADGLVQLLSYREETAGALMTTLLVAVRATDTVGDVATRLAEHLDDRAELDAVLVVDDEGRLVDDVTLFELLLADRGATVGSLVGPPFPITVQADDDLSIVLERFVDSRGTSLVVVDDEQRPVGRILADDLVDALRDGDQRRRER